MKNQLEANKAQADCRTPNLNPVWVDGRIETDIPIITFMADSEIKSKMNQRWKKIPKPSG